MSTNDDFALRRYRYSCNNPFPPPDRRYRLARACLARGLRPSRVHDDRTTWGIFRFLRAIRAHRARKDHVRNVLLEYPDWACAFDLHHGQARCARTVIEAYLLAEADPKLIANEMRVNPEVIERYRDAFYDVAPYLKHRLYVWTRLLGIIGARGTESLDEVKILKMVGYVGGPEALNWYLYGTSRPASMGDASVKQLLDERTEIVLRLKQLLAVHQLRPDDEAHIGSLLHATAQSRQAKGKSAERPLTQIEQCIKQMLEWLPWSIGPEHVPEVVLPWHETAVELDPKEEMLLASGEKLPYLEELKNLDLCLERQRANANASETCDLLAHRNVR